MTIPGPPQIEVPEEPKHRRPFMSHGLINWCLKIGDVFYLALAGLFAHLADPTITLAQSLLLSLMAVLPFRLVSGNRRVYRWDRYRSFGWEFADAAAGLAAAALSIHIFIVVMVGGTTEARWFSAWASVAAVGIFGMRIAIRLIANRLRRRGILTHRVAVVGAGPEGAAVVEQLTGGSVRDDAYDIVGIFDERTERSEDEIHGIPVIRGIQKLIDLSREQPIDIVVVALPLRARERIATMMQKLNSIPADILLLTEMNWLNVAEIRLRNVHGYSFLQVTRRPLVGSRAVLKAIEDYVVASIGILVTAPIMLVTALLIRLEGPGPILFRQRRVGFNHREFDMLKFRSMALDPKDDGSRGTMENDPRITRIGRFIRRTSIDELPQLFNVLQGHMSVVGPRAHVAGMLVNNQVYTEAVIEYAARHRVKPGITGWAQINGMRGGIHTEAKARRSVQLDLEYIDNWSVWLDLLIMARTVMGGLWGRNVF